LENQISLLQDFLETLFAFILPDFPEEGTEVFDQEILFSKINAQVCNALKVQAQRFNAVCFLIIIF
jgi:hypothetical protein